MYNSLLNLAKKNGFDVEALESKCFARTTIVAHISLDSEGIYKGIDLNENGRVMVPNIGSKSAKNYTNPIIEKIEVIFGEKKHNIYLNFLNEIVENNKILSPILTFINRCETDGDFKGRIINDILSCKNKKGKSLLKNESIISFKIDNKRIEEIGSWKLWFIDYYNKLYNEDIDKKTSQNDSKILSSISGQIQSQLPEKSAIKMRNKYAGTGTAISSYGRAAFESYGLKGNENNIIGNEDAIILSYTLDSLIESDENYNKLFGLLYWFDDEINGNIIKELLGEREDYDDDDYKEKVDEETQKQNKLVKEIFDSIIDGKLPSHNVDNIKIYMLNASLLHGVRYTISNLKVQTYKELYDSIYQWYNDSKIMINVNRNTRLFIKRPYGILAQLLENDETDKKYKQIEKEFSATLNELTNAIFFNKQIPKIIFLKALNKLNKAMVSERKINLTCLQIIKIYITRKLRKEGIEIDMEKLVKDNKDIAYNCGRLFAIYERIQELALGDLNSSIVEQYYISASKYPGKTFGILANLSKHHMKKLKAKNFFERRIEDVCANIGTEFPKAFSNVEQGSFALGYYAERQDLFKFGKTKESTDEIELNIENNLENIEEGE